MAAGMAGRSGLGAGQDLAGDESFRSSRASMSHLVKGEDRRRELNL